MSCKIKNPLFIAGCPRSGTTLLLTLVSSFKELWSPYRELHSIYEWDIGLHPNLELGESNVLTGKHVNDERKNFIINSLWKCSANTEYLGISHFGTNFKTKTAFYTSKIIKEILRNIRVVDKNPKHCFRILFLKEVFPDAKFLFLFREGKSNVASLIEGWESESYKTYKIPINNRGKFFQWSFLLPPGWEQYINKSHAEIAAFQYVSSNRYLLDYCNILDKESYMKIYYEEIVSEPEKIMREIVDFIDIDEDVFLKSVELPVINTTTAPSKDKWRKREKEIIKVMDVIEPIMKDLGYQ